MEQLNTFLAHHPPFDVLGPDELREVAAGARLQAYERGALVLVEDGPPAPGLWVILTGSMELLHEGEPVQVLEPGECFGQASMLTGMAPTFTVRAREMSKCALLSAQAGRRVLGTEAGAAYIATSMRKRLTYTGHTVHGLLDVGTTPVSAIMSRAAFCEPDEPLRDAARRMGSDGTSALLIRLDGDRVGILTDAGVRAAVAADGAALDAPVRAAARTPVPTVPADQLAIEATVEMLAADSEHLAVLDGERVCGLLSATDLLSLDARSPIGLRHVLLGAPDEDALVRAAGRIPGLFLLLKEAGVPPRELGRVLSLQHDTVVERLIEFTLARHGAAPAAWAWLDLGSVARREFTLASDQDNALAYGPLTADGPSSVDAVDDYFARFGADVNDGLVRCGIGIDNNGVMARNRQWRMSKEDWLRTFDNVLRDPDESHLIRATVVFDFRSSAGGLMIAPELTERMRTAPRYAPFMRLLARTATGYPVALGFRGQLAVGHDGDPPGRLDLKRGAIIPLVNLVRFHAIANGITISSTLDRIEAVAGVGGFERGLADALSEAFTVISSIRLGHHASQIQAGVPADNLIDPGELGPIARTDLREALAVVRRAQKRVGAWSPP
ncbi:MAG TPA: putative nucleotidyltransferase substrate binding domain-containing protein [Solirubrobacteraceae bacterium]|nr:putative nucleotidyltransferase substrate binding domain-containing protein [Solirubrobacteraceae bacterium]